ncbi:MAG: porin, partial [Planctomycetota bacterium]
MARARLRTPLLSTCVFSLAATSTSTSAQTGGREDEVAALRAEVAELRSELAQWKRDDQARAMDDARAEQVRAIAREVVADAERRQQEMQDLLTAGYDGNFFLASESGDFRLNIFGRVQFQGILNLQDDPPGDDTESGFQLRRVQLGVKGHVFDPRLRYVVVLQAEDDDGARFFLSDAYLTYGLAEGHAIQVGEFRLPFLREELNSSARALAADRSVFNEAFTLDRSRAVQVARQGDSALRWALAVSDGADSEGTGFDEDASDFAVTGRVDYKVAGDWAQVRDFFSWEGEELAVFLGAAGHAEWGETGEDTVNGDAYTWTADTLIERGGGTLQAAVAGLHTDPDAGPGLDHYGFIVQGGYFVVPDTWHVFGG